MKLTNMKLEKLDGILYVGEKELDATIFLAGDTFEVLEIQMGKEERPCQPHS